MNIETIRDSLKRTIAGKEAYIEQLYEKADLAVFPQNLAYKAMYEMLEINIGELKRILTDVEVCMNTQAANSWAGSVDRQSGAFDESELRGRDGWL